jgi:hypothetical protein
VNRKTGVKESGDQIRSLNREAGVIDAHDERDILRTAAGFSGGK